MKKNNSGFSLVELMAILLITTILIIPLLTTLIGNVEMNERAKLRRSSISISESTLYGLEKIDFSDFRTQLDAANTSSYYIEYTIDTCSNLSTTSDQNLCTEIFSSISNNLQLTSTNFKVYMFNYSLTTAQHSQLINGSAIEQEVKNVIETNDAILDKLNQTDVPSLIRVVIWIDYFDNPDLYVVVPGLIFDD